MKTIAKLSRICIRGEAVETSNLKSGSCQLRKTSQYILLILMLSCTWFFATASRGFTQDGTAYLEFAECPIEVPEYPKIDCAYLTVPEDHTNLDGLTIRLPVIIIRSPNDDASPDPVLYTEGGPGYSSLSSVWWLSRSEILQARDIIILEQRGNLYADPNLVCDPAMWLDEAGGNSKCLDSLRERGIDVTHYTTQQNAGDVDALRRALEVESWNLYGSSYSTRLYLYVLKHYPEGVRSAVLDSVNPPSENRYLHDPEHSLRALEKMFSDCRADEDCTANYPDLEASFYDVFSRLNANPEVFRISSDPQGQRLDEARIEQVNGYRFFEWMVSDAFYGPAYGREKTSFLPLLIDEVNAGRTELLYPWLMDELFSGWGSLDNFAWGLYFAINCQNDFPAITPDLLDAQSVDYPQLEGFIRHAREIEICSSWDLPPQPLDPEPVSSDIPTLILAGGYDPITPPEWGRAASENLDRAYYFEFPASGHGVIGESACAHDLQIAFLSDPYHEPDSGCVAEEPVPDFVLADEVLIAPGFYLSVADLNIGSVGGKPWLEAVTIAALFVFVVEILFLLVTAVFNLIRRDKRKPPENLIARITHPLAGIISVLGLAIPVLMTDINQALNNDPILRFFGLPAGYPPAVILGAVAPLFVLLSAALLILTLWSWVKRTGSLPKRLLLSLVVIMTAVPSTLVIRWDLAALLF
jgi:pimeloyl-ACP methyl ester carboxylesterase